MLPQDENVNAVRNIPKENETTRDYYFKNIISFSHLIGMVSSNIVEYIRSAYSKDFFPTVWNSMEEPFVQRSKSFRDSMTKPRPALYIVPKFDPSEESEFVPQSEFDQEIANNPTDDVKIGIWNSTEIVGYQNFRLFAKPRRYRMSFDLKFIFDSDAQRIQAQEYMRQSIRHKTPIQLHAWLECVIPTNYMISIAKINGFDYTSDEFLKFINTFSDFPITRRLRTGSGNIEFFVMVRSPLDMRFPDAPVTEGPVRKGNITVNSAFSDSVNVEFCAFSVYFLVTACNPGDPIYYKDNTNTIPNDGSMDTVGVDNLFLAEIPDTNFLENGCVKIKHVTLQPDKNGTDIINLFNSGILNDAVLVEKLNHYKANNKEIDFIHPLVFEDTDKLGGGRVSFNRKTLDLEIKNMDIYKTYHLYIYLDKTKVNNDILKHFIPDDFEKLHGKENNE